MGNKANEERYQKARQELIQESNRAFGNGDFITSHHIDRVLKTGEEQRKEKPETGGSVAGAGIVLFLAAAISFLAYGVLSIIFVREFALGVAVVVFFVLLYGANKLYQAMLNS